jgi:16S rRNA G966 N2-methylase RsmD
VGRFLEHPTNPQPYHVILADPPYRKAKSDADYARLLMECRALPHLLLDGGIFILEHTPGSPLPTGIGWTELRRRRYGATEVVQFTRGTSSPAITEGVAMIDP